MKTFIIILTLLTSVAASAAPLRPAMRPTPIQKTPEAELGKWSGSVGGGAESRDGATNINIKADLRYAWYSWMETVLGVKASGQTSAFKFGGTATQRLYAEIESFRPYAEVGYALNGSETGPGSAVVAGLGGQVGGDKTFVEVGWQYYAASVFTPGARNFSTFTASTGMRF